MPRRRASLHFMPKIVDHDQRRAEYTAAALRVAVKGGVDALTIRAVSREAGCSTGALAHYFGSKDDLLVAVQRGASVQSYDRIDSCFRRYDGRALLEAVILTVLPLDKARCGEWRLWLAYFARVAEHPELGRVQRDSYQGWHSRLRVAVLAATPPGPGTSTAQIDIAVDATMTLIQGLGVLGMFGPAGISNRRLRQIVRGHLDRWLS